MDTILIVDDVADNLDVLRGILKDDYKVKAVTNGIKAIEIANSDQSPDIILLDIMMPEMDGFEVCRKLKEDAETANIPVIFITAMGNIESETKGLELGAVDYITKPFNPVAVQARVKTHLQIIDQRKNIEKLLSKTLVGSIKILTDLLNALNKHASVISTRMRSEMMRIMPLTHRPQKWRYEIAALLSHVGCVLMNPAILRKYSIGMVLSEKEMSEYKSYLTFGGSLLKNIPRLEDIGQMLEEQTVVLSHKELEKSIESLTEIQFGAQPLKTIGAYQFFLAHYNGDARMVIGALRREKLHPGMICFFDKQGVSESSEIESKLIDGNEETMEQDKDEGRDVNFEGEATLKADDLKEGMVLLKKCETSWGMSIIPTGTELKASHITMIKNFCENNQMMDSFVVRVK